MQIEHSGQIWIVSGGPHVEFHSYNSADPDQFRTLHVNRHTFAEGFISLHSSKPISSTNPQIWEAFNLISLLVFAGSSLLFSSSLLTQRRKKQGSNGNCSRSLSQLFNVFCFLIFYGFLSFPIENWDLGLRSVKSVFCFVCILSKSFELD